MKWKFWQRNLSSQDIDYDYGRIEDVSVAWEFAHEEAADRIQARFEQERIEREERYRREFEDLEDWLADSSDYPISNSTRTPYRYLDAEGSAWTTDSPKYPCVAVHKAQARSDRPFIRPTSYYYATCKLAMDHQEDHNFGEAILVDEPFKPKPVVVHELVGEINSREDLEELENKLKREVEPKLKDQLRKAKAIRKDKIRAIGKIAKILDED